MTEQSYFIRAEGLTKQYRQGDAQLAVLDSLDFTVRAGEVVVVMGVSGTGKSTLLNVLGGIDRAETGQLWVNGLDLMDCSDRQLTSYRRDNVGFIFQFYNLLPSLTAFENVLMGLEARNGSGGREGASRAMQLLSAAGLEGKEHKFPEQLSGGEQQRVAIARAMIGSPPLILADEPTGNLDHATGERILALLVEQARNSNATLILVSHNHDLAVLADRTLALLDGRLSPIEGAP